MNLIDQAFASNQASGRTALIPFITVGDPSLDVSVDIIRELEAAGADMVELGVPYSDPLADGPVIQQSSSRALQGGVTIMDCIGLARTCREQGIRLPFILFTYYNPVFQIGLDRFFGLLAEHDISGIIIPDLPVEENAEAQSLCRRHGIHLIPLVAPTSHERIQTIAASAAGFIYCVSSLGVTGTRTEFHKGIESFLAEVRHASELPIAVGFGISSREQVERFAKLCDGVVVGSAIVKTVEANIPLLKAQDTRAQGLANIRQFVEQLKG